MSHNLTQLLERAIKLYGLKGVHPAANLLPMMGEQDFDNLVQSVIDRGFLHPVRITNDGLLIDGRNRLCASILAELDAPIQKHNPVDPVKYVLDENLNRRHLTTGQLAVLALDVEKYYAQEAKERQGERNDLKRNFGTDPSQSEIKLVPTPDESLNGRHLTTGQGAVLALDVDKEQQQRKSATRAAATVGVGSTAVKQAKKIAREAPDLLENVKAGGISLDQANKQLKQREQAAPKPEPPPKPSREILLLPDHKGGFHEYPKPQAKPTFNRTNQAVEWAGWTWNPVTGCLHGCSYCYARELALKPSYAAAYPTGFEPLFHHERLDAPANTLIPAEAKTQAELGRVFVCSMSDLFGKWVPQEWIEKVMAAAISSPQWEYLFLTKFPQRLKKLALPESAWIGASIDTTQRADRTLDALREVSGVRVKWLSIEPLLEPLPGLDLTGIDWVVIGAQSGTIQPSGPVPGFAPDFEWVAEIVAAARQVGCRVYLKSNLLGDTNDQRPGMRIPQERPTIF